MEPVKCGCGGEARIYGIDYHWVYCSICDIATKPYDTVSEAIEAWNRALNKQSVKVIEHDASITTLDGYKYHRSEYLCGNCKKKVIGGDDYCSHCGVRLDWSNK